MTDVNANIIVNIDSSAALVNLRRLETQIDQFQRRASASGTAAAASQQSFNKALLDGINNTGLFSAKTVMAQDSMSRLSQSIDNGKLSLGEYTRYASSQLPGLSRVFRREFDLMGQVAESRVKKMQTQYIALGKTVDGVTRAIASTPTGLAQGYATDVAVATQRQQLFNRMIDDGSTKLLNWGKNTQWAGRQLMVGFTIPMAALGVATSKTFMEIDKATVSLERVYGDLSTTTEELNRNVDAVKTLGREYTKYGISVSETIGISSRAAATGATNEKLMAATEQTLRFATLGQIDYNQALDTTISLQTAFGTSNEDLAKKIDYLNAVENQTVLTMEDMSLAIPRVATVVKGLGGDVEDLAVMMTAMKEGGISAENAANGLKSGLASLINPTKRATESLATMGINIKGIIDANKGDLMGLVTDFGSAINSLDGFSRQQVLEKVFGKFQFARMSALFSNITNSAGQAARAMDIAKMSAAELASMSDKELGKISESTSVKFQAAMENLKLSVAPVGEAFLKGLTPIINVISKIADAFNNLPGGIKNTIAVVTALLAGIAPVAIMGIGLLANGFANLIKTVQFFRKTIAGIKGDGDAFKRFTSSELEALSATEALEGSAQSLTGKLLLQKGAVQALTNEYMRFAEVAGIANASMGRMGGARNAGAGTRPAPPLRMATGGTVPGTGNKDTIPALLTPGESVITKKATQRYGPILQQMNNGTLPGFSVGGVRILGRNSSQSRLMTARSRDTTVQDSFGGFPWKSRGGSVNSSLSNFIQSLNPGAERREAARVISSFSNGLTRKDARVSGVIEERHLFSLQDELRRSEKLKGSLSDSQGKHLFESLLSTHATHYTTPKDGRYSGYMIDNTRAINLGANNYKKTLPNLTSQEYIDNEIGRTGKYNRIFDYVGVQPSDRESLERVIDRRLKSRLSKNTSARIADYPVSRKNNPQGLEVITLSELRKIIDQTIVDHSPSGTRKKLKELATLRFDRSGRKLPDIPGYALGGISIGQALKSWQTSSRAVRENPEMLAALTSGFRPLKRGETYYRSTTLGLGRGSEFSAQDHELIFNALKSGKYSDIIGKDFEVGGLTSYSQSMEGTLGALASNQDVNRIKFLKSQQLLARRKHRDDLAAIARLEANVAKGTGPVDLYKKQLDERKARVAMYAADQKAMGQEIKSLAPRGYQDIHMEQQFQGGVDHNLLDVNLQNRIAGQEGNFMGKNVARENEYIAPPQRIKVTGVRTDPQTGNPVLEIMTEFAKKPGQRRGWSDQELARPEIQRRLKFKYLDRTGISSLLRDKKAKTADLISVLSNKEFTANDLATLERNFDYRYRGGVGGVNGRLKAAIEEKRAFLNRNPLKFATGGNVPGVGSRDTVPAMLTPGEFVVNKDAAAQHSSLLHNINGGKQSLNGMYAIGGFARSITNKIIPQSLATKKDTLSTYLGGRHGTQSARNWTDPLSQKGMMAGVTETRLGPGAYLSNNPGTPRSYSGMTDVSAKMGQDGAGYIYKTSRNPIAIAKLLKGKGYFPYEELAKIGISPTTHGYQELKKMGYHGVTQVQANGELFIVDFTSGSKWYNKPKLANAKNPFGRKQGQADRAQFRDYQLSQIKQAENRKKMQLEEEGQFYLNKGGMVPPLKFATGGKVPGTGNTDKIPALLTPGEAVITKEATAKYGSILDAMNKGTLPGFNGGYAAPEQVRLQTQAMPPWASQQSEIDAGRAAAQRFGATESQISNALDRVAAHIVPSTGPEKPWVAKNLMTDFQGINNYLNRVPKVAKSILDNTKTVDKIVKRTGLSSSRVQVELNNLAKGIHPTTEIAAKVLKNVADMDADASRIALAQNKKTNIFGTTAKGGYQGAMVSAMLNERIGKGFFETKSQRRYVTPPEGYLTYRDNRAATRQTERPSTYPRNPNTVKEAWALMKKDPRITREGALRRVRGEQASRAARENWRAENRQTRIEESGAVRRGPQNTKYSNSVVQARALMQENPNLTREEALRLSRTSETRQRAPRRLSPKIMGGAGTMSMALGMGSMLPMMAQNEQGKFLGMDANTAMMGMMGGSALLGIAPMLAGVSMAVLAPIAAVAAGAAVLGVSLKVWRDKVNDNAKKSAELGASMGGTANALNTMSKVLGVATPAQKQTKLQLGLTNEDIQSENFGQFQQQLSSDAGKAMLEDLRGKTTSDRVKQLTDYITNAIAAGIMDQNTGQLFAKTIGMALQDAVTGSAVASNIRGQRTGTKAMLEISEGRLKSVEKSSAITTVKNAATETRTVSTDVASYAIGAAVQVVQDYSNVIAKAREDYANGILVYNDYIDIVKKATAVQEQYSAIVTKSVQTASDQQGARQALDAQLVAGGMTQDQVDALTHATDIGVSSINMGGQGRLSAYASDYVAAKSRQLHDVPDSELTSEQRDALVQESGKAQSASMEMFQNGINEDIKMLVASGKMQADQAVVLAQNLMNDSLSAGAEQYRKQKEAGNAQIGLEQAGFINTANTMGIPGIGEKGSKELQNYIDIGIRFSEEGGSLADYQSFINNLPDSKKVEITTELKGMGNQATTQAIVGGQSILETYGQELGGKVLSSRGYAAAQTGASGASPTSESLSIQKRAADVINTMGNDLGAEVASDVVLAVDTKQNGKEIDTGKWISDAYKLQSEVKTIQENFPSEILSRIKIDFTSSEEIDKWSRSAEVFKLNYLTIQNLDPRIDLVASMQFLTLDSNGNALSAAEIAANVSKLNSAWSTLDKSKNKKLRKEAYVTIVASTMLQTKNEKTDKNFTTEEAAAMVNSNMDELAKQTGGKVYTADPTVVQGALSMKMNADQMLAEIEKLEKVAEGLEKIPGMSGAGTELKGKIVQLKKDVAALNDSAAAAVISAPKSQAFGGGGGGGGKTNPITEMNKGFIDQIKMYDNVDASLKMLNGKRSKLAATLSKGKGIVEMLRKAGLSETVISNLAAQGSEALKKGLNKFTKKGKLTEEGKKQNILANVAGMANMKNAVETRQQMTLLGNIATKKLKKAGASQEIIDGILGNPEDLAAVAGSSQRIVTNHVNKMIAQAEREMKALAASNPTALIEQSFGDYEKAVEAAFSAEEWRISTKAAEEFAKANGKTVEEMQRQVTLNERNIRLEQEKIDKKQKDIDLIQRTNDKIQTSIDKKRRDDEIAQRPYEAMSHQLELMSQQEQKIRDAYDERVKALDKIASINDHLISQQQQQLGLASALSQGDVYAAAAAQQEMQSSNAQYAVDQNKSALQAGMENQIKGLTIEGGLTREQAEKQIADAKERSYQVSLLIRDEEDAIYNNNLLIKGLNNDIYDLQNGTLKTLTDQNAAYQTKLSDYQTELDYSISIATAAGMSRAEWEKAKGNVSEMINNMVGQQSNVEKFRDAWIAAVKAMKDAGVLKDSANVDIKTGGVSGTQESVTSLSSSAYTNPVSGSGSTKTGGQIHYRGGLIKKYAAGSFVYGDGGRDSVPATLTPGEFIMRKSSVKKYGQAMFEKMNMGAFSMPTYDLGMSAPAPVQSSVGVSNINAPVYNTYSINVPVTQPGASADEIANKVMTRIKSVDNSSIRRINGY